MKPRLPRRATHFLLASAAVLAGGSLLIGEAQHDFETATLLATAGVSLAMVAAIWALAVWADAPTDAPAASPQQAPSRLQQYLRSIPVRIALAAIVFCAAYVARNGVPYEAARVLASIGLMREEERPAPMPLAEWERIYRPGADEGPAGR